MTREDLETRIADSKAIVMFITQKFSPDLWNDLGRTQFITRKRQMAQPVLTNKIYFEQNIEKNECSYFNSQWIDLSQFEFIYDGIDCSTYNTGTVISINEPYENKYGEIPLLDLVLSQDRHFNEVEWTVMSVDIVLGIIGGFVGLIWGILTYLLGGYQGFRF